MEVGNWSEHERSSLANKNRIVELPIKLESCKLSDDSELETMSISSEIYSNASVRSSSKSVKHEESGSSGSSLFYTPVKSIKLEEHFKNLSVSNMDRSSSNLCRSTQVYSSQYNKLRSFVKNDLDFGAVKGFYDDNGYYSVNAKKLLPKPLRGDSPIKKHVCRTYSETLKFLKKYDYLKYRNMHRTISLLDHSCEREDYAYKLRKWKRPLVPKQQLDEELDRYMAEAKLKNKTAEMNVDSLVEGCMIKSEKMNVDSFVEEYMIKTEKYIDEYDPLYID